jgi:hypothetical protein
VWEFGQEIGDGKWEGRLRAVGVLLNAISCGLWNMDGSY